MSAIETKEEGGRKYLSTMAPIMFAFLVMGFVDVVGISTNYVKADFGLSDTVANFLPMMVFIWFLVFSVPSSLLMNRLGRKNTVLLSVGLTGAALIIPVISYSYGAVLLAFALLGIGNTVLQVSLNPLVAHVVKKEKIASFLTLGQFVKAVASFSGPIVAGFAAASLGDWKNMFPIFAAVSVGSGVWLLAAPIRKDESTEATYSFKASFSLLLDGYVALMFLGILAVVGVDVGMNISSPKILMEGSGLSLEKAGLGTSVYFGARTIGTLGGAWILSKIKPQGFLKINMIAAVAVMGLLMFVQQATLAFILIALTGLTMANVFSIIFSSAMQAKPSRMNEISGLMIMGVSGGALLPPVMGVFSDWLGYAGGVAVMLAAAAFLLFLSMRLKDRQI